MRTSWTIVVVVGLLAAALLVFALRAQSDEEQIRSVVEKYTAALDGNDYQAVCDLLSVEGIQDAIDLARDQVNCLSAVPRAIALADPFMPRSDAEIRKVNIRGDHAQAQLVQIVPAGYNTGAPTVSLVKTSDGWKVASIR
jgi:hypothetical protein